MAFSWPTTLHPLVFQLEKKLCFLEINSNLARARDWQSCQSCFIKMVYLPTYYCSLFWHYVYLLSESLLAAETYNHVILFLFMIFDRFVHVFHLLPDLSQNSTDYEVARFIENKHGKPLLYKDGHCFYKKYGSHTTQNHWICKQYYIKSIAVRKFRYRDINVVGRILVR